MRLAPARRCHPPPAADWLSGGQACRAISPCATACSTSACARASSIAATSSSRRAVHRHRHCHCAQTNPRPRAARRARSRSSERARESRQKTRGHHAAATGRPKDAAATQLDKAEAAARAERGFFLAGVGARRARPIAHRRTGCRAAEPAPQSVRSVHAAAARHSHTPQAQAQAQAHAHAHTHTHTHPHPHTQTHRAIRAALRRAIDCTPLRLIASHRIAHLLGARLGYSEYSHWVLSVLTHLFRARLDKSVDARVAAALGPSDLPPPRPGRCRAQPASLRGTLSTHVGMSWVPTRGMTRIALGCSEYSR